MANEARLPAWLRKPHGDPAVTRRVRETLEGYRLNTVCDEALCPNRVDCLSRGTATFMILGDVCTRNCGFCAVRHGAPLPVQSDEPARLAEAARALRLSYVVVTSVTRDDVADGGASHFAATVRALRQALPGAGIEVLVPDFAGDMEAVDAVVESRPDVLGHNVETVERLYPSAREGARYERTLSLLARASRGRFAGQVKSALMLGLGETRAEMERALDDLESAGVEIVCLGQYLRPSAAQLPVARFVAPSEFEEIRASAMARGFASVVAGPFVRSSYNAERSARRRLPLSVRDAAAPRRDTA